MKIRKPYDIVDVTPHKHSLTHQSDVRLVRDSSGNCSYVEVGSFSVTDYVQSFAKGCSLTNLLERCSLMPTRDKILMLNQREVGQSVDCSALPTDLTDAFIKVDVFSRSNPAIMARMRAGESIVDIIKSINTPKEVENNGTNEPSNE